MRKVTKGFLDKANEWMKFVECNIGQFPIQSVHTMYYACFFAAQAALNEYDEYSRGSIEDPLGNEVLSHVNVADSFYTICFKEAKERDGRPIVTKDLYRAYTTLKSMRKEADYRIGDMMKINIDKVEQIYPLARKFVNTIDSYIKDYDMKVKESENEMTPEDKLSLTFARLNQKIDELPRNRNRNTDVESDNEINEL